MSKMYTLRLPEEVYEAMVTIIGNSEEECIIGVENYPHQYDDIECEECTASYMQQYVVKEEE